MEIKTLTQQQAETIVMAAHFVDVGEAWESKIKVDSVEPTDPDKLDMGIAIKGRYLTSTVNGQPLFNHFVFYVGYYNKETQTNPQYLDLSDVGSGTPRREGFGNIGYITDKLREYGIW